MTLELLLALLSLRAGCRALNYNCLLNRGTYGSHMGLGGGRG